MQLRTFRPGKPSQERIDRIQDHLKQAIPFRDWKSTAAIDFALWYVDELFKSGKLTQADIVAQKAEAKL